MSKQVYVIDGAKCATIEEFWDEISRVLIPGASWGRNLDAFCDILRGGFGTPDGGFVLEWRDHHISRDRLGYPETVRQLEQRLSRCHPSNRDSVECMLSDARQQVGPTVFDWLVEIIEIHCAGGPEEDDGVELVLS